MARKPHVARNYDLVRGISRYSRSAMFRKSGRWAKKNKKPVQKVQDAKKAVVKKFGKDGKETREIKAKGPRSYPTEDVSTPIHSRKHVHRPTRLRSSMQPGTVLVLLAGRFRGKRVVFLKQLKSGLLLVTGPYKINGVPLRRINQVYAIATSTKVDISGVKVDPKFDDAYFKRPAHDKKKKTEEEFFAAEKVKKTIAPTRSTDQKAFDAPLLAAIKKVPQLREYLKAKFSLKRGQYPHELKF